MSAEHTQTPWRVGFEEDGSGPEYIRSGDTSVAVVLWGCSCCKPNRDLTPEEQANAAFIVRACNTHDDMLAALEEVERWDSVSGIEAEWSSVMEMIRAAIAKARGVCADGQKAANADLLAALEDLVRASRAYPIDKAARQAARAAIAKARGQSC